jgi:hypothetical protein
VALTSLTGIAAPSAANPSVAHAPASVVLGQPLAAAHAHNDYEHKRPLVDALERGFTSVDAEHRDIMSRYSNGTTKIGPVTAVISGNRSLATMQAQEQRFGFYDGRSADLTSGMPAGLMPLVSDNWTKLFTWQGVGPMPEAEGAKLQAYVAGAHAQGYRVSFWATPDQPSPEREAVWNELFDAGVDHINTDDLAALEQFLAARTL